VETEKGLNEALENELKKQKDQAKDELKQVKDKDEQLLKEYNKISGDYFDLRKLNIDMRAEIQALKQKLDAFEERHKIESPVGRKKRRRTDPTLMEPKVLKAVEGQLINDQGCFPLDCKTRQYEGDWTGFELENAWTIPIILRGWSLTDANQTSILPLPERRLNPRDIIRVCFTPLTKEANDLVWKDLKLKAGEQQELWVEDNLGSRHRITVIPIPPNTLTTAQSCFVM